ECEENPVQEGPRKWVQLKEGIYNIGHSKPGECCFDNELGRHKVYLQEFEISNRLVTNGEYLEFMEDRGYRDPLLWHLEGWDWVQAQRIEAPLYWRRLHGVWHQYTLKGLVELDLAAPLAHVSY